MHWIVIIIRLSCMQTFLIPSSAFASAERWQNFSARCCSWCRGASACIRRFWLMDLSLSQSSRHLDNFFNSRRVIYTLSRPGTTGSWGKETDNSGWISASKLRTKPHHELTVEVNRIVKCNFCHNQQPINKQLAGYVTIFAGFYPGKWIVRCVVCYI